MKVTVLALIVMFGIGLLCCTIPHPAKAVDFLLLMITMALVEKHPLASGEGLIASAHERD
ncbi:hypothetical protein [Sphingobium abikonense]|uniref:hypothetical protein n=1 Tax=Sphingobium abikonense TaxID=86193 RepID=UPI0007890093|nr:hypothetical protein [Sphingobium abikonense]